MTDDELVTMCGLLLAAGNVTTTDLIGNGTLALLRHPGEMQKLRDDPSLIKNAVEEMLRYDPPVTETGRIPLEGTDDPRLSDRLRRVDHPGACRGEPRPGGISRSRTASTLRARTRTTIRSEAASTSVLARHWRGSKRRSRWTRWYVAFPRCGSPMLRSNTAASRASAACSASMCSRSGRARGVPIPRI